MNKTEAGYAKHLELRKQVGEIAWYCFEGMKFRLADNTFYEPDFVVMLTSGELQIHETKGAERVRSTKGIEYQRPRIEDDARVKLSVFAEMYPFPVFTAHCTHVSGWVLTEV